MLIGSDQADSRMTSMTDRRALRLIMSETPVVFTA